MKRLIFGSLSVLLMSGFGASAVLSQTPTTNTMGTGTAETTYQIQPFNLAWMAYQGYFESQGIPSGISLTNAFKSGDISARDIVEGAIKTNRLPSDFTPNNTYLSWVEMSIGKIDGR